MHKTLFITGGAGGIGSATALEFAKNGYTIALNYHITAPDDILPKILEYSPHSKAYQGDMSDYAEAKAVFAQAETELDGIDCLINNAGISYIGLFNTMQPDQWQRIISANINTMLNCSHLAIQGMLRRRRGSIINISSMWGEVGASCETVYSATKGAMDSFTRALAKESAPNGIRVNAIACGVIDTAMNACLTPEERSALTDEIPLMRYGTPEEVAKAALFLASDDSSYVTGQVLRVNGGFL